MQAQSLASLIDKKVTQGNFLNFVSCCMRIDFAAAEGYIGMALAGSAAAVGALLIAGIIRRATRK